MECSFFKSKNKLFITFLLIIYIMSIVLNVKIERNVLFAAGLCSVLPLFLYVAYLYTKKKDFDIQVFIIFVLAFIIRLLYILYTDWNFRQHDIGNIENMNGHSGYILYLLNNKHLPNFDPTSVWQFYHPPLHHFLSAVWIGLHGFMPYGADAQLESVQFLTLFYSCVCMYTYYLILNELGFQKERMVLTLAISFLAPIFVFMSGQINNDQLSLVFMLIILLYTIRWIKVQTFNNILPIAFSFGFGMMTKLSVASLAFPVGIVFIIMFIKSFKNKNTLVIIKQYIAFLAICAPLGLWWSFRCLYLYKMPLGYVPRFPDDSWMFVGQRSVLGRLFKFITHSIYMDGDPLDFNPTIGLLKTWVFEEYGFNYNPYHFLVSYPLFFVNLLIVVSGIYNFFNSLQRRQYKNIVSFFLGITLVISMVSYYLFCFGFPHACTMNIRYATPIIFVTDILFTYKYNLNNDIIKRYKEVLTLSFSVLSILLFITII